jgi:hypothetical protein
VYPLVRVLLMGVTAPENAQDTLSWAKRRTEVRHLCLLAADGANSFRRLSATLQEMAPNTLAPRSAALVITCPAWLASRHNTARALGDSDTAWVSCHSGAGIEGQTLTLNIKTGILSACHDYSALSMTEPGTRTFPPEGGRIGGDLAVLVAPV